MPLQVEPPAVTHNSWRDHTVPKRDGKCLRICPSCRRGWMCFVFQPPGEVGFAIGERVSSLPELLPSADSLAVATFRSPRLRVSLPFPHGGPRCRNGIYF